MQPIQITSNTLNGLLHMPQIIIATFVTIVSYMVLMPLFMIAAAAIQQFTADISHPKNEIAADRQHTGLIAASKL